MEDAYHIGILGGGAVGQMLAFLLQWHCPSCAVHVFGRQGPQSLDSRVFWGTTESRLTLQVEDGALDLLFVALKSYDLRQGLSPYLAGLRPGTVIVLLSNGYIEPLVAPLRLAHPQFIWRKGVVTRGIRMDEHAGLHMGLEGEIIWGGQAAPTPIESFCFASLASYGFAWRSDSCRMRRDKWFFNTVLNTLCAAYQLPCNGDALDRFEADLKALSWESFALGQELWEDWEADRDELWLRLRQLIQKTAQNENSMARDRRLGRSTEAEALSGCLRLVQRPEAFPMLRDFHRQISGIMI